MLRLCLCALILIKSASCEGDKNTSDVYKKLRNDLLESYDRNARPVIYGSKATLLEVIMHFLSAFEIDEKAHVINVDGYMSMHWLDEHLKWNSSDYEGIEAVEVSTNEIWLPDVYEIFNGGQNSDVRQSDFNFIMLQKTGMVNWYFASMYPGCCKFDYSNYPNDVAQCKIIFQAWSLRGDAVDIKSEVRVFRKPNRRDKYFPREVNPEWHLTDTVGSRGLWQSKDIFYPSAEFTITLNRRTPTLQQQLMWISSVIVILLTLDMFWIPSDIEQKVTVGCVIMVIMTATLLTVTSTVSTRQPIIIIANKIHSLMYAVTIAILLEIIAINLQHIQEWKPPEFWLSIFSGTVGRVLLISSAQQEAPALDKMKLSEYESGDAMLEQLVATGNWKTISQAFDRVAFLIFIVVLSAVPKTL